MTRRSFFASLLFRRRKWSDVTIRTDGTRWQVFWVEGRKLNVVDCPGKRAAFRVADHYLMRNRA